MKIILSENFHPLVTGGIHSFFIDDGTSFLNCVKSTLIEITNRTWKLCTETNKTESQYSDLLFVNYESAVYKLTCFSSFPVLIGQILLIEFNDAFWRLVNIIIFIL